MDVVDASLMLFFTQGVSLKMWIDIGMVDRELEIYRRLSKLLKTVSMVTYGGAEDKNYLGKVDNIKILPVIWHNKRMSTIIRLLLKYRPEIRKTTILKTNQIRGSEIPVWLKKRFEKKLITRCGYLHSRNTIKGGKDAKTIKQAMELEKRAFHSADMGIVTSEWQREWVVDKHKVNPAKIKVIPNYVVTDVFMPAPKTPKKYDFVFVGRGGKEKNLENLIRAINSLKERKQEVSLALVGGCSYDKKITQMVNKYKLNVSFKGNIPNFELPKIINQARIYILPSYYEGHPKTLLEAMSCGMPCIGTNVTGIKEDIEHLVTGYLCETDYESIAGAVESLLDDKSLQTKLGKNARDYIIRNYSIDRVLELELEIIKEVLNS